MIIRIALVIAISCSLAAGAAEPDPEVDRAIARGLVFLASQQSRDGAWDNGGPRAAMAGLSLMSFLASGNTPGEGKYGATVRKAVDYLLSQAPEDGYFGRIDGSRMYGHGIITLALLEAYGVEPDPATRARLRDVLNKSVKVILDAQDVAKEPHHAGGWRYEPQSTDSDLSLSGWNALALRAARSIGIEVPRDHIDRARLYVLRCYVAERGGFAYQPAHDPSPAMTGVAVLNLFLMDASERSEVKDGAQFLVDNAISDSTRFPYYSHYYSTQAAFQAGEAVWAEVWKSNRQRLLANQSEDGGWQQSPSGEEPGRAYATSMAVLTLSVPYRLLPTYQR